MTGDTCHYFFHVWVLFVQVIVRARTHTNLLVKHKTSIAFMWRHYKSTSEMRLRPSWWYVTYKWRSQMVEYWLLEVHVHAWKLHTESWLSLCWETVAPTIFIISFLYVCNWIIYMTELVCSLVPVHGLGSLAYVYRLFDMACALLVFSSK